MIDPTWKALANRDIKLQTPAQKVVKFSLLPDEESSKKPEERKKESKHGN